MHDITYNEVHGLPVVIVDDYYKQEELNDVWRELNFLSDKRKFKGASETGAASHHREDESAELKYKKNASGIFLNEIYKEPEVSDINVYSHKIYMYGFPQRLERFHKMFKKLCNKEDHSILLNYYENNEEYDYHNDSSYFTATLTLFREPKNFEGGRFFIEEELEIDPTNNRLVIFPGILEHKVEKVTIAEDFRDQWYGRYSITQFIG